MIILLFLYGLILGSFYNVVGLRVPLKTSIVTPGSSCPSCGHRLTARELIPVLSYIIQRGRCSQCKEGISPLYPLMEFATGALFAFAYYLYGWQPELLVTLTLVSLFMIITVSDLAYMLIPDKILGFFALMFILERLFIPLDLWWDSLLGAASGFALLLVIAVISRGGMGGGDIKLFAVIGFVLGAKGMLLAFFLATLFGAVCGIIGLSAGFYKKGKPIAFGPYIVVGTLVSVFYGRQVLLWYSSLFI
ncbi:prepilin peptidase [Rossellomorea marisflavi]|uniref:prepilin peptidase n=1 Tax=Rossellomorea marisflavi TaxID=189381 RepID=UPI00203A3B14|nr:A24 family peptidase [Rossellomorea marisflavi]MCM2589476.1 prepilin peptidase [Rossellomorea marisflavi]